RLVSDSHRRMNVCRLDSCCRLSSDVMVLSHFLNAASLPKVGSRSMRLTSTFSIVRPRRKAAAAPVRESVHIVFLPDFLFPARRAVEVQAKSRQIEPFGL